MLNGAGVLVAKQWHVSSL